MKSRNGTSAITNLIGKITVVVSATSIADAQQTPAAAAAEEEEDEVVICDPDADEENAHEDGGDAENPKTAVVKEVIDPNLIQAMVIKLNHTDQLGIGFENVAGRLQISHCILMDYWVVTTILPSVLAIIWYLSMAYPVSTWITRGPKN
jgi:hypothetical protein